MNIALFARGWIHGFAFPACRSETELRKTSYQERGHNFANPLVHVEKWMTVVRQHSSSINQIQSLDWISRVSVKMSSRSVSGLSIENLSHGFSV